MTARVLSISASEVALLSGYKPQCNDFIAIVERYIYQQREELFFEDVAHLNMEIVSKKRRIEEVISSLGAEQAKQFSNAMESINVSKKNAKNVSETSQLLANIVKSNDKQLSTDDKVLLNEVITSVKTSYGEYNESFVLDFYEDLSGNKVEERNAGVYTWQIHDSFIIKGKIDGLVTREDGTKIVIEVKNRVNRILKTPPFYDQVQLVTYCLMLQTNFGHLIESITSTEQQQPELVGSDVKGEVDGQKIVDLTSEPETRKSVARKLEAFSIFELDLTTQTFHTKQFHETVVPRLKIFVDAMQAMLLNDEMRYQWLKADYSQKIDIMLYYLTYLDNTYFILPVRAASGV